MITRRTKIARLKKLRDHILRLSKKNFNMGIWCRTDREDETIEQAAETECGTQACLAGWAVLLLSKDRKRIVGSNNWFEEAKNLLGLSFIEAQHLFYLGWEPILNTSRYVAPTRKNAAKVLDVLIKETKKEMK